MLRSSAGLRISEANVSTEGATARVFEQRCGIGLAGR